MSLEGGGAAAEVAGGRGFRVCRSEHRAFLSARPEVGQKGEAQKL